MIGFTLGLVVFFWLFIIKYPQWILAGKEYVVLSTNPNGLYLLLLVFFPGLIFSNFLLSSLINNRFPSFVRYVEKASLENRGIKIKADSRLLDRKFLKLGVVLSVITLPLIMLAADNYYYVDNKELHYNSFLSFGEKSISLDNLLRVEADAWSKDGEDLNWEYLLVFNDNKKFNLKEADLTDLKELDTILFNKGVPLETKTSKVDAMSWVNHNRSQELKDLFSQVFSNKR